MFNSGDANGVKDRQRQPFIVKDESVNGEERFPSGLGRSSCWILGLELTSPPSRSSVSGVFK